MPEVQVDKGAIRFVLGGANIMCPGLTSKGGRMEEELPAETAVVRVSDKGREGGKTGKEGHVTHFSASSTNVQAIRAEGKEMVLALGLTKMSTTDMYVTFYFVTARWCPFQRLSGLRLSQILSEAPFGGMTAKKLVIFLIFSSNFSFKHRREKNKDIAIELIHYVNDGLWRYVSPEVMI